MAELKKEIRRLKADLRKTKRLLRLAEEEGYAFQRLLHVVRDSLVSLPPLEVPKFIVQEGAGSEEVALLMLSDVHVGKKTKTFNHNVFIKRLRKLEQSMISVITAHRAIRPIKELVIVFNGDVIDAESIYPSQSVDHASLKLVDQIFSYALPQFTQFLYFCLENFERVTVYGNKGNHGRLNASKWSSSKSSNWEFIFLKALEAVTKQQPRIEVD